MEHKKLHFIIGSSRSGTTLLMALLNDHSKIQSLPEIYGYLSFLNDADRIKNNTDAINSLLSDIISFIKARISKRKVFQNRLDLNLAELQQEVKRLNITDYESLITMLYSKLNFIKPADSKTKVIIEKNPSYAINIETILSKSASSKFIYIVRDYRAQINSIISRKNPRTVQWPTSILAWQWEILNKKMHHIASSNPERFKIVRYEDLCSDTESTLKTIYRFLNLKDEDLNYTYVDFYNNLQNQISNLANTELKERRLNKIKSLAKKPNASGLNKWKDYLNHSTIELIENICANTGDKFDYTSMFARSKVKKLSISRNFAVFLFHLNQLRYKLPYRLQLKLEFCIEFISTRFM